MSNSLEALFSLRGRVALVTGASAGLGVECATALAIAGANVAIVARRAARLEQVAKRLARFSIKALPIPADVTLDADLDRIVSRTVSELGEIDILVNNAGIALGGSADVITRKKWNAEFAVNVTAPMMLAQRVARRLAARKSAGRIINITSMYASLASPYRMVAYAASKAALENLTRELAVEWAPYGINVNAISPGMVPTELNERALKMPGIRERTEAFTPLGRLGRPEELRGAVIYLAGAASSYVTGSVLPVDGGYHAW
jgi:NAD(P)-dependent dehydrogenase (short-subunit alcohol dehydrogenase family)